MKPVRVAQDGWNFQLGNSDEYIVALGGNMLNDQHPGQGNLFQNFNAADCDRRFGLMAELGLNCLRQAIGVNEVYDPVNGLKAVGLKNWDIFIGLAEKHGVYLMPVGGYLGGNDWFDVERLADSGKELEDSCAFWKAFCGHYASHPAIWAWDLRNELLYDTRQHMVAPGSTPEAKIDAMLKENWPRWLEVRYGSLATMNRLYHSNYASFQDVPASVRFEEKPYHLAGYDFRNYLNDRGYQWCKAQCETIREAAPGHMICQGNNGWLSPDQDLWLANGFHNRANYDLFDFVTHHPYPALQCLPGQRGDPLDDLYTNGLKLRYWLNACIGMSRLDFHGKPVMLQEFGWYGGGKSQFLNPLPYRSELEHADYIRLLCETVMPHVNGFINWPLMDMPAANDISNHGGIFNHKGERKQLAKVYSDLAAKLQGKPQSRVRATVTLEVSLLGLFTQRSVQDTMWDRVHEIIEAGEIPDFRFI